MALKFKNIYFFKCLNFGAKSIQNYSFRYKLCWFLAPKVTKIQFWISVFLDTKVGLFVKILGYTKKGVRLGGKKVGKNLFTVIFSLSEEEIVDNSKVPLSHVKLFTFGYSMARVKTVVTLSWAIWIGEQVIPWNIRIYRIRPSSCLLKKAFSIIDSF